VGYGTLSTAALAVPTVCLYFDLAFFCEKMSAKWGGL
jgi:hypothetical protein